MSIILAAARYAERMHRGVYRKYNGDPYIVHPTRVAGKVSYLPFATEELVAAAWLHDVVEDCGISANTIDSTFSVVIGNYVRQLTNPSKEYPHLSRRKRKQMDLEHIAKISKPVKVIKMIDRMDNLNDFPLDNQEAIDFVRDLYYNESLKLYDVVKDGDYWIGVEFAECLENIRKKFSIGDK